MSYVTASYRVTKDKMTCKVVGSCLERLSLSCEVYLEKRLPFVFCLSVFSRPVLVTSCFEEKQTS